MIVGKQLVLALMPAKLCLWLSFGAFWPPFTAAAAAIQDYCFLEIIYSIAQLSSVTWIV